MTHVNTNANDTANADHTHFRPTFLVVHAEVDTVAIAVGGYDITLLADPDEDDNTFTIAWLVQDSMTGDDIASDSYTRATNVRPDSFFWHDVTHAIVCTVLNLDCQPGQHSCSVSAHPMLWATINAVIHMLAFPE